MPPCICVRSTPSQIPPSADSVSRATWAFFKKAPDYSMKIKTQHPYPFDYVEAPAPPMDENTEGILRVHHALWNKDNKIKYKDKNYDPYIPSHQGYNSVILPNENGYHFLWITHNLNKSSAGTEQILRARSQGDDMRITWVVDNSNNSFKYVGVVKTCDYFDGKKFIIIERYTPQGTIVVYCTDPSRVSKRSSI